MNEKPRILLVDDDESTRQMLSLILRKTGYEIETAATGEDALKRVRERAFNVAFLDIRLPDIDGVDLIAPLREMRPHMAVVVVTGYASVDTAVAALTEGASGYITKPVDVDELLTTVQEALEKQRLGEDKRRALEALRDSEDKHRTLVEQSLQGVVVVQDFRIVFANATFADIAGRSVEELLALSPEGVQALIHPEDQEFVWARFRKRLAGRPAPARYAYRAIRKDGAVRWLDMFASRIEYEGKPAVQAAIMDITDRRQAEKALRESEARNRALLNAVPDLMFVQRRDGTYLDCHATKTDTLLLPPQQYLGKRMQDLFPEDLATTTLGLIEQSIATGTMQVHEYQLTIAGQPRWFELRIVPYEADRVLSIIREITERKQAERATRERQRYLEGVLSAAPDAIVTLDAQNRIVEWNAGAEQLFGYERQEVIGRPLDPLVSRGDALEEAVRFTRLVSGAGTLPPTETVRYRRGGSPVDVIVAGAPIVVDDELVGVVAVYTDITERKRAEEALARRHRELTSLYQTVTAISSDLSLEAVLQAIAEEMVRALGSGGCAVSLWNRDENQVETLIDYSLHRPNNTEPAGTIHDLNDYPATLRVLETGQALLIHRDDPTADEAELAAMEESDTFTLLMLPLVARDQVLGLMELYDDLEPRIYTPEDIRLGESLASQAAVAIENARLYKETQQLAAFNEGIVQGMAEGVLMEDAEGHITFVNTMAAELLGYAPRELLGQHWRTVTPAGELAKVTEESSKRPEGAGGRYETALLRSDGSEVPVLVSARPIFDNGRFSGVLSVFTDITERKQAEQALQRYAKRLETLHEVDQAVLAARSPQETAEVALDRVWQLVPCTGAGIVLFDFEAGEAMLLAVQADLPVGLGPGTRLSLAEIVDVERLRQGEVMAEEDLLGGDPTTFSHAPAALQALASAGVRSYVAAPLIAQDGLIGALGLGSASPGAFSPEHVDIVREVADQLAVALHQGRLRAELETERRRLETTVEHVPEGILLLDAERRILVANPAAREHLPMLTDASVGDVPDCLADRPLEDLLAPLPEGLWHELQIPGPPLRIYEALARSVAEDEPQPEGWVLTVRDVTEERKAQEFIQRQERLAAVGQLAGGIAHDFNNFLSTIMLYGKMIADDESLSSQVTSAAETIIAECSRASDLVGQILDFSRRSTIEVRSVDLVSFLEEVCDILQNTLPENIQLITQLGSAACLVDADPTRIQQVVMNLAINARDAMPDGGDLRIALSEMVVAANEDPPAAGMGPGEWVCLTVSDTGTGMTEEVIRHIFEPFFTTKERGQGTGLGLSQVYGIVKQHHGFIDLETELGVGTTFHVYLPVFEAGQVEEVEEISSVARGRGEMVLLVEDHEDLRGAGRQTLETLGYRTLTAANGQDALEMLEGIAVDLVITDVVMPVMGGKALMLALRERYPDLPVLAVTGYTLEQEIEALAEAGFSEVLHKPLRAAILAQAVRRALDVV